MELRCFALNPATRSLGFHHPDPADVDSGCHETDRRTGGTTAPEEIFAPSPPFAGSRTGRGRARGPSELRVEKAEAHTQEVKSNIGQFIGLMQRLL